MRATIRSWYNKLTFTWMLFTNFSLIWLYPMAFVGFRLHDPNYSIITLTQNCWRQNIKNNKCNLTPYKIFFLSLSLALSYNWLEPFIMERMEKKNCEQMVGDGKWNETKGLLNYERSKGLGFQYRNGQF